MTSFIIASTDKTKRAAATKELCDKFGIDHFDITVLEKETSLKQNTQSIGIEDIKHIQKKIFLKPIKSQTKAVIIEDAQLLTHEAQNALLKVLEEPPAHTIILLATDSKEALLATILSRCQLIELPTENQTLSTKDQKDFETFIHTMQNLSIGEKLKKAEQLAKDKDKAIVWIGKLILVLRKKMLEDVARKENETMTSQSLIALQSLYTLLKTTNVNPRFAIENTLLSL